MKRLWQRWLFMMQPDNPLDSFMGELLLVLAETVASVGTWNLLDMEKKYELDYRLTQIIYMERVKES